MAAFVISLVPFYEGWSIGGPILVFVLGVFVSVLVFAGMILVLRFNTRSMDLGPKSPHLIWAEEFLSQQLQLHLPPPLKTFCAFHGNSQQELESK